MLYVSSSRCRGLVCDCGIFLCLSCSLGSGKPFRSSSCVLLSCGCVIYLFIAMRGLVCDCDIFLCLSFPLGSGKRFRSSSCVLLSCGCKYNMSLPRGAMAWSVTVTFSCASHSPWDQVSASGPLVVLCCRVTVLYVSSSRCRDLVCDCGIYPCLSCPLGSGEPFRSSCCVLLSCGCKCYMSLPRGAVTWSVIVTFSCASHAIWIQVRLSGPLVVFCCRVAVLYVSSSPCRGLVCDCDIFLCLSYSLGLGVPFRSSSCVLLSCGCVICLFLTVTWLGL